ncbi:MAG TPA: ActS/PrrB/RegB family redox-sensitive histidine kinase [Rhizomicrobium sp.]|jgi:two-component system sensor histidine kinase RegB|nr:ActS/PrrB/RegB family redox-sensitive histidine kinase [Rhizomicrobium sp.]
MTAAPANTEHAGELRSWRRVWPLAGSFFGSSSQAARGRVRLRTLSNLRWLAIGGQAAALFVVHFGLEYRLPLVGCLIAIASSAALNTWFAVRFPATHRLTNRDATVFLAFDVLQLGALLYLTGGIENPFALMFLAPVVIAAATLNLGNTLILAALALASVSVIALVHYPVPWIPGQHLDLPPLYQGGIWASLVIGIGFTSIYAWRIASEASRMQAGLAATQLALAREHRVGSLGALAAAAAHELGTPLGTIAVVARELERTLPPQSPEAEDARLLRAQAERCRGILTRLARPEESVLGKPERLPLGALLDQIAGEHRGSDITIDIHLPESAHGPEPKVWRIPELLHGLGNLVANAADFARTKVGVSAEWNMREICFFVEDDGPGFEPEILERIGEPYVTSRPGSYALGNTELGPTDAFAGQHGMGLGFFIAKILVEQTGGTVKAKNREEGGARIILHWPRGAIDGEIPPGQIEPF